MGINVGAFKNVMTKIGTFTNSNATVILGVAACIGVVGVAVSAVKAQKKADDIIRIEEDCRIRDNIEDHTPLKEITTQERVQMTWKCYIPTVILGVGTIACIASGTTIGVRRLAAATLAYEAANGKLNDAKEQFNKLLGESGTKMFDTATSEKMDAEEIRSKHYIQDSSNDEKMFWVVDPFGRRWITCEANLREARNYLNETINDVGSATLNEWYAWNDLDETTLGNSFRWDRVMHIFMNEGRIIDGIPHLYLDYSNLHCELDYNIS